jgi:uncharacterized protein (DUF2267 family)
MDQRSLFGAVSGRTALSREESADVTRAVLQELVGQLSEGEARRLAADLPGPLSEQLQALPRRRNEAHPVPVGDFTRRVSRHTGLTDEDARAGAAAVIAVLHEALGDAEYGHVFSQLPAEYSKLAETAD